jgi:hypothetical protein
MAPEEGTTNILCKQKSYCFGNFHNKWPSYHCTEKNVTAICCKYSLYIQSVGLQDQKQNINILEDVLEIGQSKPFTHICCLYCWEY